MSDRFQPIRSRRTALALFFVAFTGLILGAPLITRVSATRERNARGKTAIPQHSVGQPSQSRIASSSPNRAPAGDYINKLLSSSEQQISSGLARLSFGAATGEQRSGASNGSVDEQRAAILRKLSIKRQSGAPFAIQEIEILDAFEAGLTIALIEADIVISRTLYDVYVAGKTPTPEQRNLLGPYRTFLTEHARDVVARNAELNADFPTAIGISGYSTWRAEASTCIAPTSSLRIC